MESKYSYHVRAQFHQQDRSFIELEHGAPRIVHFSPPPEFGGEPGLWTPEHFLLASVASCFISTFKVVAKAAKLDFRGIEVPVDGTIERDSGGFRFTRITLHPALIIYSEEARELADRLLQKAEKVCLVSRSLSSSLEVLPKVLVEKPVSV